MRIELFDRPLVAVAVADVVARGEDVAGIEADADALLVVDERDDPPELLERAAEARALSGRGLEQRDDFVIGNRRVNLVERPRDLLEPASTPAPMCAPG